MVRQSALQIRCLTYIFKLENGVTTEGSCSLFLYYDHVNSITKNTQLLKWHFANSLGNRIMSGRNPPS